MTGFDMRSFCDRCGELRGVLPFGLESDFFDRTDGPCRSCGEPGPGHQHICRRVGRWWSPVWVDRGGNRVDVPSGDLAK
jgi:hypothetical protein